jgi:hypothetical protein
MADEFTRALRQAFLESLRGRHVVVRTPRFAPAAYSMEQLRTACVVSAGLGRGEFVLLEDPEDGR